MSRARITTWTLLLAAGFALAAPRPAAAQDLTPIPKKPDLQPLRDQLEQPRRGGMTAADLKKVRESSAGFAKFIADVLAHPLLWKSAQEFKPDLPPTFPYPSLEGQNGMFRDLDRFLLEPVIGGTKVGPDQADYIREFGRAFDAALKDLIETHPERIVRINACRVLAHVARAGAPAHYETLTALLTNPNTTADLRYHLFQAAGALLGAADPTEIKLRKHSGDPKAVGALVRALQACVTDPALLLPGFKAEEATADQFVVVAFVRRQAIRALGHVKFAALPGPDGKTPIFPAHTLVCVLLANPALVPTPGPAEAAEAVLGLCHMRPPAKGFNADVAVEAIAAGLNTFATPRAANVNDRSLPWRAYSLRLAEALRAWRPMFDPDWEPAAPAKFDASRVPPEFEELYKDVVPKVLAPIEKVDSAGKADSTAEVKVVELRERVKALRSSPKRSKTLFDGFPETSVEFAPSK
jgi:hypothetical protein